MKQGTEPSTNWDNRGPRVPNTLGREGKGYTKSDLPIACHV